jgi:hypothetical protein
MVAAVVTVVLVAGGVLAARVGSTRSPAVLPALDLAAAGQTADATAAAGPAEPAPATGAAGKARARPPEPTDLIRRWPRDSYRLGRPLPALPDRARAWKVTDGVDAGRVAALAAALGLHGRPVQGPAGWTVRDGRRGLQVLRLAGAPFSYGLGLSACSARLGGGPYRPGGGIQCLDLGAPVASRPATPGARPVLPGRAEAERVARDLAARAGLDLAGAGVQVGDGWAARTVTIAPAVGGQPTAGFAWTVTVGARGVVQGASGYLATPVPADTYPLIGVAEGFQRLQRAPQPNLLVPMARVAGPAAERLGCPVVKVPCTGPLPPRTVTVTGVRLGLLLTPAKAVKGRPTLAYLLPAYLFDLEGGWTDVRPILAVPDRYLTRP